MRRKRPPEPSAVYGLLMKRFGPQNWWPARTRFEVITGAILTQATSWNNVEMAIRNLRNAGCLTAAKIRALPMARLEALVHPCGFYRQKARRLKDFVLYLFRAYGGDLKRLFRRPLEELRPELLGLKGMGYETVDSILLYAGGFPVFVVDAYTLRIGSRLGMLDSVRYEDVRVMMQDRLRKDVSLYGEFHALIVRLAKENCLKTGPVCRTCPLFKECKYGDGK